MPNIMASNIAQHTMVAAVHRAILRPMFRLVSSAMAAHSEAPVSPIPIGIQPPREITGINAHATKNGQPQSGMRWVRRPRLRICFVFSIWLMS